MEVPRAYSEHRVSTSTRENMLKHGIRGLATTFLIAMISGCGGDGTGTPTDPGGTGSLAITVTQVNGVPASVHVSGPGGYVHTMSSTATLSDLPIGVYTITADSSEHPDTIVGAFVFAAQIAGSPATVRKGATNSVSVVYGPAHQRGALWMASPNSEAALDFGVDQLRAAGDISARTQAFAILPNGIAFDATGVMWLSALDEDTLRAFSIAQRSAPGTVQATKELQSPSLAIPEQMAFDGNGTLWVADYQNGLLGFAAAQLAAGGVHVNPAYSLQDTSSTNPGMQSVAIDRDGNAWIAEALGKQVVEYTAAQLQHSGTAAPAVRITSPFRNPVEVTFDSHDNLWVADVDASTISMFTPAQRVTSGALVPSQSLAIPGPYGLAFDNSGNLWFSSKFGLELDELPADTSSDPWGSRIRMVPHVGAVEYPDVGKIAFDPWITASGASGSTSR